MRNVFDQYEQPENRATHALATALARDSDLLRSFLVNQLQIRPPRTKKLRVSVQQIPGSEARITDERAEQRGLPDFWVFDDSGWCTVVECKIAGTLTADQIRRHILTARRQGFETIKAAAITAVPNGPGLPDDCRCVQWKSVYSWLRRQARQSEWAESAAEFLEILEARMNDKGALPEGTLTEFSGIPFGPDYSYSYQEVKRLLKLALDELRQDEKLKEALRIDPSLPGRPAITGRDQAGVWDFLRFSMSREESFTKYPHLTLSIHDDNVQAMVTIPHAVRRDIRRRLQEIGLVGFQELAQRIVEKARPVFRMAPEAAPWFIAVNGTIRRNEPNL